MAKGRIKVGLELSSGKYVQGVKKAKRATKGFQNSVTGLSSAIKTGLVAGGITLAVAGIKQLIAVGKEWVGLAAKQQQAEAALAGALREKGRYTKEAHQAMLDFASAEQARVAVGDEDIIGIQKGLVQFGLFGDELKRSTRLILDMTASGKNMQGSIDLLGRAFNGNTSLLSRYGVEAAKVAELGGGFIGAMRGLEGIFKGQAEALRQTDTKKLEAIGQYVDDMKEFAGAGIASALSKIAESTGLSAESMASFNKEMGQLISKTVEDALLRVAIAFSSIEAAVLGTASAMSALWDTLPIGGLFPSLAKDFGILDYGQGGMYENAEEYASGAGRAGKRVVSLAQQLNDASAFSEADMMQERAALVKQIKNIKDEGTNEALRILIKTFQAGR